MTLFDKNSFWDEFEYAKKKVVCQEEKIARYWVLSQDILGIPGQGDFGAGLG
jgi:hypothetical protein